MPEPPRKRSVSTTLGQKLCPVSQGKELLADPARGWEGKGDACKGAVADPTVASQLHGICPLSWVFLRGPALTRASLISLLPDTGFQLYTAGAEGDALRRG